MSELRDQIARAIADSVMTVVDPIVAERDQALAAASDAEDRAFAAREDLALGDGRLAEREAERDVARDQLAQARVSLFTYDQRLSDVQAEYLKREQFWDRTRDRLTRERALALWLHAEAVWNWRHLADRYDRTLERERALRASAVVLPPTVQRLVDWHLSMAGTNVSPMPTQSEMRAELASWRPAAVEATPPKADHQEPCGVDHQWERIEQALAGVQYGTHVGEIDAPPDDSDRAGVEPPTLAETRTGTDWCANCRSEAGANRCRDDGGTERCATCGSELEAAPSPTCSCDATGAPEFPHRDYCELKHPHHPCDPRLCRFADATDTEVTDAQ